jgi:hypothetical protein
MRGPETWTRTLYLQKVRPLDFEGPILLRPGQGNMGSQAEAREPDIQAYRNTSQVTSSSKLMFQDAQRAKSYSRN